ncbi:hypothetical protein [Cohnella pontilimi]|uniref:hypothetical protein n=1 Tax=Cohnella pontilimi TaxID=2564100 RepID=UPI00145E3F98|nr:hypothetical protein [Cohnella pontilimi]
MFVYGQDIPLDDVVPQDRKDPIPTEPASPMQYPFEYGKDIYPETSSDSSIT